MFFSVKTILESIENLKHTDVFFGITFLVCKENKLPVGDKKDFPMDNLTKIFMDEVHRVCPNSKYYFLPFSANKRGKQWASSGYPSEDMQTINTQTFKPAFLHEKNTKLWGWHENYVSVLEKSLTKGKIPMFYLAVWIYKQVDWPFDTKPEKIIARFIRDYSISIEEQTQLFDEEIPQFPCNGMFQDSPADWADLSRYIQPPPDAAPNKGGILSLLELENVGPSKKLTFIPTERLNIITGDNGLGKSFLLDCVWWSLTGKWTDLPAYPNINQMKNAKITFEISEKTAYPDKKTIRFDTGNLTWPKPANKSIIPGIVIYVRVDGSIAVFDPRRNVYDNSNSYSFNNREIWDGIPVGIEGLIRDWTKWQNGQEKGTFKIFSEVLKRLSPPELGDLIPGDPIRIPNDLREIPTIKHPYGTIPILYASAGIKRIIMMAYMMVWAWNEHKVHSDLFGVEPESRMVVLIDEIEAHLHPKWQRAILPALLGIHKALSSELDIQFFIATHSPLIMASAEPVFDKQTDQLFHLEIDENFEVNFEEMNFIKYGQVNSWLTSSVFNLRHARSVEAEKAIEDAKKIQLSNEVDPDKVLNTHKMLIKYLAQDDHFWPRWIYYAEKHGVKI